MKISNVEKRMTSGGANTPRIDLKEVIEIADAEKYEFDALNERLELLQDAWLKQREPGETFDSWFKRTPREEIIRITLSSGGKVIKFSDYKKPKIKKINLSSLFEHAKTIASLTDAEREVVNDLLRRTLGKDK